MPSTFMPITILDLDWANLTLITVTCSQSPRRAPAHWLDPGCCGPPSVPADLRVKSNFSSRIKLFLLVQSALEKYSDFPKPQISFITPPSTPLEGRIAIVTDAGLDAMDASGAKDESVLLADGEVVWS
jgi:hypothetical protein